jgi:hypothetical protein
MADKDDRHTLDKTKELLRKGVWEMERSPDSIISKYPAALLLLLWLIDHISQHDCAPVQQTRWDELGWFPRVQVPVTAKTGSAKTSPAKRIAVLRGLSRQSQEQLLNRLRDHGIISFDKGFQNIEIKARDADDLPPLGRVLGTMNWPAKTGRDARVVPLRPRPPRTAEISGRPDGGPTQVEVHAR